MPSQSLSILGDIVLFFMRTFEQRLRVSSLLPVRVNSFVSGWSWMKVTLPRLNNSLVWWFTLKEDCSVVRPWTTLFERSFHTRNKMEYHEWTTTGCWLQLHGCAHKIQEQIMMFLWRCTPFKSIQNNHIDRRDELRHNGYLWR